jgi:hypothetical protein
VDLIIIDTVHLSGQYNDEIKPIYKLPLLDRSAATIQWDWLEQQLKTSTAQYLLVGGHYPVSSTVCIHSLLSSHHHHQQQLVSSSHQQQLAWLLSNIDSIIYHNYL